MLVLANVDQKCAGRPHQCTVVPFVFAAQILDGIVHAAAHDQRSLGKVELVEFGQQIFVFWRFLVAILH